MTKTFPAKRIAELRQRIGKAAQLPEECPEGWSKSTVDPMAVLVVCKPLFVKGSFYGPISFERAETAMDSCGPCRSMPNFPSLKSAPGFKAFS